MNYCIQCGKVLVNNVNFVSTRTAQMDSGKYIYFCDECGELIDSGFFKRSFPNLISTTTDNNNRKLPIDKNLQEAPIPKEKEPDHIVTDPNFIWS